MPFLIANEVVDVYRTKIEGFLFCSRLTLRKPLTIWIGLFLHCAQRKRLWGFMEVVDTWVSILFKLLSSH